jgi:hypothetical protein
MNMVTLFYGVGQRARLCDPRGGVRRALQSVAHWVGWRPPQPGSAAGPDARPDPDPCLPCGIPHYYEDQPESTSGSPPSGALNLSQMGMMVKKDTAAATTKGDWGLIVSHISVPKYGAGRESTPMLP